MEWGINEILSRTVASGNVYLISHSGLQANKILSVFPLRTGPVLTANSYGLSILKPKYACLEKPRLTELQKGCLLFTTCSIKQATRNFCAAWLTLHPRLGSTGESPAEPRYCRDHCAPWLDPFLSPLWPRVSDLTCPQVQPQYQCWYDHEWQFWWISVATRYISVILLYLFVALLSHQVKR